MKKIAFSVTNCICFDQRVQKIAETVSSLDCDVTIIGRHLRECCVEDSIPFRTKKFSMLFKKGFLFYKFINVRIFFYLLFHRFDILVANDLDTLLPNFMVSILKRIPLVYDSHEYFRGVPEIQKRPFVKWVWTLIEKIIFPHLKYVMTVSDSIADIYNNEYGKRPVVVRNCARSSDNISPFSRDELGIPRDHLFLILQGGGINIDRGAEELVEAVSRLDKVTLLIAGSGDVIDDLKEKTIVLNCYDRIKFLPPMPWEEMMRYTRSADAGVTLDKDTNLNYRFSLPNKLFDYISAGIPVIAGDLPEVSRIIGEHDCGIIIPQVTVEEIAAAIMKLRDDRELLNKLRQNAVNASGTLTWDSESKNVKKLYSEIISS
ncbi:MAG: glycosyltransferase family 4 protein [Bacteroidales bacterium]|nr:glycosyltransferase family 4 protein [Bacteroidales bacterium]MBN2633251.1 glycosyltransferase family 4 protein [Bacteroidales bacterium]